MEDFHVQPDFIEKEDVKVIMLFRDPRAIINSIRNSPDEWHNGS